MHGYYDEEEARRLKELADLHARVDRAERRQRETEAAQRQRPETRQAGVTTPPVEELGARIAADAERSAGVRFEERDAELDRAWAEATSLADFEKKAFDIAWARALRPLNEELMKKKNQRRPPTPQQVIDAVAPSWAPGLPGGGARAERPTANRQATQGTPSKAREAKKHLDRAWDALR